MLPEVFRGGGRGLEMTAPPRGERCAVCRGVDISVPHQANCSHWFCGHCIWLLDQPFYIRRMLTEFRDTCREPPLFFKIQVGLAAALSLLYLVSPMDLLPEAVLGYRGLLDDIVVFIAAYAYISAAYQAVLVAQHAA